jgi:hypothetical protein
MALSRVEGDDEIYVSGYVTRYLFDNHFAALRGGEVVHVMCTSLLPLSPRVCDES